MRYIKVLATDSTNIYLKQLFREKPSMENTCLITDHQTQGRGQYGSSWASQANNNLTFSILIKDINLNIEESFKLSALVGSALADFLNQKFSTAIFTVKWPNDILAVNKKVCGILIENILKADLVKHSIIGIGLNVNQTDFMDLPNASSLRAVLGHYIRMDVLLKEIVGALEDKINTGLKLPISQVLALYKSDLFGLGVSMDFEFPDGGRSKGSIRDILPSGKMEVEFDSGIKAFDLKEIKMLY